MGRTPWRRRGGRYSLGPFPVRCSLTPRSPLVFALGLRVWVYLFDHYLYVSIIYMFLLFILFSVFMKYDGVSTKKMEYNSAQKSVY